MSRSRISYLVASAVAVTLASQAQAQQAGTVSLQEIVVTATKRSESLQDVPVAVTAYSGELIRSLAIADIEGLAVQTPSFAFSKAGGEAQIYIRGVGTNIFGIGADPSVAVNLDGVYLGRTNMGLTQFLDIDRVEILRGPQGTLYGRNATGGAINLVSRMPTRELEGYVTAGFGEFDRTEFQAAVGGPLDDQWAFRIAGRYLKDDGYTEDLDPRGSNKLDDNDIKSFRGILQFTPNDAVTATLIGEYTEFSNDNTSVIPRDDLGLAETLGAVPTGSIHKERNDLPTFFDWDSSGVTLNIGWDLGGGVSLTSITGWKNYNSDFLFNTDGTEIDITRSNFKYDTDQWSQELRLDISTSDRWQLLLGAYYFGEDKKGGLGLVRASLAPQRSFIIPSENNTDAWAVFAEATFNLSDKLSLIAGVRYSDEEKEDFSAFGLSFDVLGLETPGPVIPIGAPRITSDSWDAWTPKLGIDYRWSEDVLIYGSATRGFKSGGYNSLQPSNPAYDPEYIWAYEAGIKSQFADDRIRLNGAIFYYDYTDLQVSTFLNNLTFITNAAAATVMGVELELLARPTEQLELGLAVSYLDTEYDKFLTAFGSMPCTPVPPATTCSRPLIPFDASGNQLINAPEWKANATAQYTVPLGGAGSLVLFGQLSFQDDLYFTQINESAVGQEAITLFDARAAWLSNNGSWEVAAYGKNLTDEDYFNNGVRFTSTSDPAKDVFQIGNSLGYPAPGRNWGVQATYRF
jgi:iron complex outermembrane receptor protein